MLHIENAGLSQVGKGDAFREEAWKSSPKRSARDIPEFAIGNSDLGEQGIQLIRTGELLKILGIAKSTLYSRTNPADPGFDPTFPRRIRLWENSRTVFYVKEAVDRWVREKTDAKEISKRGEASNKLGEK